MLILSQYENGFFDLEKFVGVVADMDDEGHGVVYINGYDGVSYVLGEYKEYDRAKEIVKEIYSVVDCMSRYSMPIL